MKEFEIWRSRMVREMNGNVRKEKVKALESSFMALRQSKKISNR